MTVPTLPPNAVLAEDTLKVEPGSRVQTILTISNRTDIVEGFRLQVLGEMLREWAEVMPAELQIYPGQEGTAVVAFMPPSGSTTQSGSYPFAVRVESVTAETTTIAEGDVEVGKVFGLNHKITPVTSEGRWRGRHLVTLTNWGNSATQLTVTATDPDEKLAFLILPDKLDLPVGRSASTRIEVKTRRPTLRGTKTRLPFQVVAEPDPSTAPPPTALSRLPGVDQRKVTIDAAFNQKPILSRFVVILATLLLAGGGGGIAWALTRPAGASNAALVASPPNPPADLAVTPADQGVLTVTWSDQPGIEGYTVFQKDPGGAYVEAGKTKLPAYKAAGLTPGSQYCFRVEALRAGFPATSEERCATTAAAPTVVPTGQTGPTAPATGPATGQATGPANPTTAGGTSPPVQPTPRSGATTAGGATSAPTTGRGPAPVAFAPGDFVSVVWILSDDASDQLIADTLSQVNQKLSGVNRTASYLLTRNYPTLKLSAGRTPDRLLLFYVPGFSSDSAARAFCTAAGGQQVAFGLKDCLAAQPQPQPPATN